MLPPPAGEEEEKTSWLRQKEGDEGRGEAGSCNYFSSLPKCSLRRKRKTNFLAFANDKQKTPICNLNLQSSEYLLQWNHLLKEESSSIYHLHAPCTESAKGGQYTP